MSDQKDRPLHDIAAREAVGKQVQLYLPRHEMWQHRIANAAPHGLGLAGQRVYRQPWRIWFFDASLHLSSVPRLVASRAKQ